MWSQHYPQPLAELIAVIAMPFDGDEVSRTETIVEAHKVARREVKGMFAVGGARPSGGQIEASLHDIACRLLDALKSDEAMTLAAERLKSAIVCLGDIAPTRRSGVSNDLVVPDDVRRLDRDVPFAMWR